jgi:hypothetical protein
MTRKHFKGIAAAIKEARNKFEPSHPAQGAIDGVVGELVRFLSTQNTAFDVYKFKHACERDN